MSGKLIVVATPIGNLGDISQRALDTLNSADLIAAEDTRQTKKLLTHFSISKPVTSYFEGNEVKKRDELIGKLLDDETIALVSDAGMPCISDPGALLVAACHAQGIAVEAIPGASSVMAAAALSGFVMDRFTFLGFLPRKGKERKETLQRMTESDIPIIFFESPNRIEKTLQDLTETLAMATQVCAIKEISKMHETLYRGSAEEVASAIGDTRGEWVVVVDASATEETRADAIRKRYAFLKKHTPMQDAEIYELIAAEFGIAAKRVRYSLN